jgi:Domain of unknown function (DUF4189)
VKKALTAAALLGIATALAPVAHAEQYIGLAIYDVADSDRVDVGYAIASTASEAQAQALASCNSQYSGCQPVGTSTNCIAVVAGPGTDWVYSTGTTMADANANVSAKAEIKGWDSNQPLGRCVGG